jgi:hypothetical protein
MRRDAAKHHQHFLLSGERPDDRHVGGRAARRQSRLRRRCRGPGGRPARGDRADPRDIDGFASYSDDRNQGLRLAGALGIRELRFSNMVWGGGGGGGSAAVANAAAAIHAIILTSAERAKDLRATPAYLLGAAQGAGHRTDAPAFNGPDFASANFTTPARRVYEMAGVGPQDIASCSRTRTSPAAWS